MKEEDQVHLTNIANYINEIEAYVAGMDYQQFADEEEVRITVMENLQHIGQATALLSDEYLEQYTAVDIQVLEVFKGAKFSDGLEIDFRPTWSIIQNDLPLFRDKILTDTERMDVPKGDDISDTAYKADQE